MIKFFRRIRQQLVSQNKFSKYMFYAIGEIVLVVLGILIALQVNKWNQQQQERKSFEFGLKQVYKQTLVSYFDLFSAQSKIQYQLEYMDSIVEYSELIDSQRLPGVIQMFDYSGFIYRDDLDELLKPYLKLNPNNETQNELALAFYGVLNYEPNNSIAASGSESTNTSSYSPSILFYEYLENNNISLRFLKTVQTYPDFINPPTTNYYSELEIKEIKKIISTPDFLAKLKTIRNLKNETLLSIPSVSLIFNSTLTFLKENYPLSDFIIDKMEIIGSGTKNGNWGYGVTMASIADGVFELETELQNGEIKFRTDSNWTFDWGGGLHDMNDLAFKGTNIPVIAGKYKIILDINENNYSIIPLYND